jgi:hypothetical protein
MRFLLASLLLASACSSASADRVAVPRPMIGPRTALAIAPVASRAPYDVQVVREDGESVPTYQLKDRFYVQGNSGERYTVRVTNPTANRVEAVVTVDGLDVIDGEAGDLHKRGYIVPAYGEVKVEGFRTSQQDVATFRFSAVSNSYAGQKGAARNVGVIAVAIFEEQAPPPEQQIIMPTDGPPPPPPSNYDYRGDLDSSRDRAPGTGGGRRVATADKAKRADAPAKAPRPSSRPMGGAGKASAADASVSAGAPAPSSAPRYQNYNEDDGEREEVPAERGRPGLGTEFGESRYSAVSFTRFVRAAGRPIAIAELRYNDAAGLIGLGIPVQPLPDQGELMTRETADPFPGDTHFATPPR